VLCTLEDASHGAGTLRDSFDLAVPADARAVPADRARGAGRPPTRTRMRLLAVHYTIMENANDICHLAVCTCGGQAMGKSLPLERLCRDSRCGSLMLPWTAELCVDRLGRVCLYEVVEGDEAIES
jgi:alkylation response protein AidB-like acyl-CoA dehydrogenase